MRQRYFAIFYGCDSLIVIGEHVATMLVSNEKEARTQCNEMVELLNAQSYSLYEVTKCLG